jgi:PST family polysaccharide transporter
LLVIPVALSVIFSTASIVPLASLQKESRFISIARCEGLAELISLITILILFKYIEPIWALTLKPLVAAILKSFFLWLASSTTVVGRPKFGAKISTVKKLLSFSLYQFGFNIVNYFSRNLDNILVGKYFSTVSLGVYDKAYQLMRYPLMLLTFAMNPAIQPVLTEIKDNPYEFERLHNKFVRYMSLLGLAIGISVYLSAELIVKILLGEQWLNVIPLLEILSLTIPIQIVLSSSGGFFQAAGRADLLFKCGVFSAVVNVIAIVFGILGGTLEGLCWSLLISFSINFMQCYFVLTRNLLPSGFLLFLKQIWGAIIGTILFSLWVFYN